MPSDCPSNTYTTQNGYQFTTYCGIDLLAAEVGSEVETSMTDCMEHCSWFQPACYGITYYTQNRTCSYKAAGVNSTMLSTSKDDNTNVNSAIANLTQMVSLDITCPYQNNSIIDTSDGMPFQILCDTDMTGYGDYFPWGFSYTPHTDTMIECMELCSHAHPLCLGISWNPSLVDGYGNCYLKSSQNGVPEPVIGGSTHSGLVKLPVIDACSSISKQQQISSNDKVFNVTCFEGRVGSSNITSVYSANITGCVDQCATYTGPDSCLAVFYDNSFADGFDNCYLLNATGSETAPLNATYAELVSGHNATSTPAPSSSEPSSSEPSSSAPSLSTSSSSTPSSSPPPSPTSSGSDNHSSSSKAWVAGPVLSVIAAGAILALGFFWLRKRAGQKQDTIKLAHVESIPPLVKASEVIEMPPHYVLEMEGSNPISRRELEN
ncbi:hypothetical protein PISL3812_02595 [Talaromyces islandicus]|uniref:Apple domain-containing protein n=1 Tax=Talaromyces islandicus TaxID=28573 RepID=A0A0U1LQB1_TALIS|nr:hypothetical protein PISL3812_02595 [Talaromyces islandicus]